jgi:uncharacterized protein
VKDSGLVHVSEMAAGKYIDNPHTVVKPGDIVQVRIIEIDVARSRISLSMKQV